MYGQCHANDDDEAETSTHFVPKSCHGFTSWPEARIARYFGIGFVWIKWVSLKGKDLLDLDNASKITFRNLYHLVTKQCFTELHVFSAIDLLYALSCSKRCCSDVHHMMTEKLSWRLSSPNMHRCLKWVPLDIQTNLSRSIAGLTHTQNMDWWHKLMIQTFYTGCIMLHLGNGPQGWPAHNRPPAFKRNTSRNATVKPVTDKKSSVALWSRSIHCLTAADCIVFEECGIKKTYRFTQYWLI